MKQTAVEWLTEQIEQYILTHGNPPFNVLSKFKKQAKEMEKQQIITAYNKAVPFKYGKEYYEETYNLSSQDKP